MTELTPNEMMVVSELKRHYVNAINSFSKAKDELMVYYETFNSLLTDAPRLEETNKILESVSDLKEKDIREMIEEIDKCIKQIDASIKKLKE